MTQTHLPPNWIRRLCGLMQIHYCAAVRDFFQAWARAEGGTAEWDPLNTTLFLQGSTFYNSVHVENFPDPVAGIGATGATLALKPYRHLWVDLQQAKAKGYTAATIVRRNKAALDTWGTGWTHVLAAL